MSVHLAFEGPSSIRKSDYPFLTPLLLVTYFCMGLTLLVAGVMDYKLIRKNQEKAAAKEEEFRVMTELFMSNMRTVRYRSVLSGHSVNLDDAENLDERQEFIALTYRPSLAAPRFLAQRDGRELVELVETEGSESGSEEVVYLTPEEMATLRRAGRREQTSVGTGLREFLRMTHREPSDDEGSSSGSEEIVYITAEEMEKMLKAGQTVVGMPEERSHNLRNVQGESHAEEFDEEEYELVTESDHTSDNESFKSSREFVNRVIKKQGDENKDSTVVNISPSQSMTEV